MAEDVVAVVADRLAASVPARTVYRYGVPDGVLPDSYLLVTGSTGETTCSNQAGMADMRTAQVDVSSVSRNPDLRAAAREALWGARATVDSLTDYRPDVGRATWHMDHLQSYVPRRDDALPEPVMVAVERYLLAYQP